MPIWEEGIRFVVVVAEVPGALPDDVPVLLPDAAPDVVPDALPDVVPVVLVAEAANVVMQLMERQAARPRDKRKLRYVFLLIGCSLSIFILLFFIMLFSSSYPFSRLLKGFSHSFHKKITKNYCRMKNPPGSHAAAILHPYFL